CSLLFAILLAFLLAIAYLIVKAFSGLQMAWHLKPYNA
ncbi:ARL6IP6 isoform 5, partial [Pan troglodytes]